MEPIEMGIVPDIPEFVTSNEVRAVKSPIVSGKFPPICPPIVKESRDKD